MIRHEGRLIGGIVDANGLNRPNPSELSQWIVAMSVDDVDVAVRAVEANGGRVRASPVDVAERGLLALVEDSQGAALALLQTRDGNPLDGDTPVGGILWDELWTEDAEGAIAFYRAIAPYDADDRATASGASYRCLTANGRPRVGILKNPAPGLAPTWVTYIRTADPRSITTGVEALGGEILAPPQERDLGGQVAFIADPSGAGIAIQTLSIN